MLGGAFRGIKLWQSFIISQALVTLKKIGLYLKNEERTLCVKTI
jgi:hypothetical protein